MNLRNYTKDEIEKWRAWALKEAEPHGLELEVNQWYEDFLEAGDPPAEAAHYALCEWDI